MSENGTEDARVSKFKISRDRKTVTVEFTDRVPERLVGNAKDFGAFLLVAAACEEWLK